VRATLTRWGSVAPRSFWILVALILVLGAETRFLGLSDRSLWFDEAFGVSLRTASVSQLAGFIRFHDTHPPLYYVLLKGWTRLFGSGEIAVRSLSALCGLLMVPLLYVFARRLADRGVALAAAAVLAGSAFAVHAAQEARMYPLLGLLALASWFFLLRAVEEPRVRYWVGYVLSSALAVYTHYFGFLVLGSQALYLCPRLWRDRRTIVAVGLAQGAVLLLFLPWAPAFLTQLMSGKAWPTFRPPAGIGAVVDLLALFGFGGELFGTAGYLHAAALPVWMAVALLLPFLALVGMGAYGLRGDRAWLLFCYWGVPIAVAVAVSQRTNIFYPRYFSFLAPGWALLTAAGIGMAAGSLLRFRSLRVLGRPVATLGLVIAVLAANAPVINGYSSEVEDVYNWRAAAELVSATAGPNDYIIFVPGFAESPFEYYYKGSLQRYQLWPVENFQMMGKQKAADPAIGKAWARRLAEAHPSLWIVATVPFPGSAFLRLQTIFEDSFGNGHAWDFHYVYVFRLQSRFFSAAAGGPATTAPAQRDRVP
jgi:4-amino-4-deoxy-L-arabinose transferase-like glycosyltransferase